MNSTNPATNFGTEGWKDRKLILYHCTDAKSAALILADKRFLRGHVGAWGGGIYFAESIADAERKAIKKGVVLSSEVNVGISLVANRLCNLDYYTVTLRGCNSVKGTCLKGNEYIVYNNSQPREIRVVKGLTAVNCRDPLCARYGSSHYGECGKICQNKLCKMNNKKHRAHCKNHKKEILWRHLNE